MHKNEKRKGEDRKRRGTVEERGIARITLQQSILYSKRLLQREIVTITFSSKCKHRFAAFNIDIVQTLGPGVECKKEIIIVQTLGPGVECTKEIIIVQTLGPGVECTKEIIIDGTVWRKGMTCCRAYQTDVMCHFYVVL